MSQNTFKTKPKNGDGEYLQYTFPQDLDVTIAKYSFTTSVEGTLPVKWILYGLMNNSWTPIKTIQMLNPDIIAYGSEIVDFTNPVNGTFDTITPNTSYVFETEQKDIKGVRITISDSSGDSVHLKQFRIYDQIGEYVNLTFPFCTDMSSLTHTGSLNGSQVDSMNVSLSRRIPATFYAVSHNILKFENGMASTLW